MGRQHQADMTETSETVIKEKHGVSDPMPELPITSSCVHSRVDFNKCTLYNGLPYARVDLSPMPESTLTLCQSRSYSYHIPESTLSPSRKSGSRDYKFNPVPESIIFLPYTRVDFITQSEVRKSGLQI
jgi:hypothetical protein